MMAKGAGMGRHALKAPGTGPSRSDVSCTCSVSQPVTSLMPVSHTDLFVSLPRAKLSFDLPSSINDAGVDFARMPVPDRRIPDPPPKAFSS